MYPILLQYGPITISSFGVMMVCAFLLCNYLLKKDLLNNNLNPNIADDITFRAAIGGIIGAKVYYLIENIHNGIAGENINGIVDILKGILTIFHGLIIFDFSKMDFSLIALGIHNFGSGLVFLGGLLGGMLSVFHYTYKNNLKWLSVADWSAPYLALGHGIGRIGCFLVGDDYGVPSTLPWACAFPNGLPPTDIPVHPTQIYEMICYFIIYKYLKYISRSKEFKDGNIFYEYLFLAGFFRFLIEFIRTNPKYLFDLSGAQIISIFMMIVSMIMLHASRNNSKII